MTFGLGIRSASRSRVLPSAVVARPVYVGTLVGGGNTTTNPTVATGSVTVVAGDAIVAVGAEQLGTVSITSVTDNLGNVYEAPDASGFATGTVAGHGFCTIVTNPGILTSVSFTVPPTSNDIAVKAVVFGGPFTARDIGPTDKGDFALSWTGNPTGVLAQPLELVAAWIATAESAEPVTAVAPWTMAGAVASPAGLRVVAIAYVDATATTSLTPTFSGVANTDCIIGSMSFKRG